MSSGRERLYSWDDKSMEWYINAVNYQSFHSVAADMILKSLPENPTVCDIGCGIGALTMHLAPKCKSVLAMDLNLKPLIYLEEEMTRRGHTNVEVVCGDFDDTSAPNEKYDAAIFCLAGGVPNFLGRGAMWAKKIFFIENATDKRSFSSVGKREKEMYCNEDIQYLDRIGVKYKATFFKAPFGQVFKDRQDAESFMHHYDKYENEADIQDFLDNHLEKISHPEFSLYMPNEKPLLFLEIEP